jgi:NAD+ kinase
VRTVGVLARPDLVEAGPALRELLDWLKTRGVRAVLDEATAALGGAVSSAACHVATGREVAAEAEALVVLGGDGTLLAASRLLDRTVPVLGVNFGSLGFLTEIALSELYPTLQAVLEGCHVCEERRLLHVVVNRAGRKSGASRIIEMDVSVDGLFVSAFRADGVIVSSPTGSTAYNLAAGGPILHPTLPAIVLTPICPHMLTNRPLVVADDSTIEVRLVAARDIEVTAALDGQQTFALTDRDGVVVTRSKRHLQLVKAHGRDFYEVLRSKLKWGDTSAKRRGPDRG